MSLREKLSAIQQDMKAPKNLYNTFGGYNYRNAEGILEAFKPYEKKHKVALVVSDLMQEVGGRVYVTATATLLDTESEETIQTTASAREQAAKKGMDEAQITGAASSYARKYALNGLFLLDDTKDPDTDEARIEREVRAERDAHNAAKEAEIANKTIGAAKAKSLEAELSKKGVAVDAIYRGYGVTRLADLTEAQHASVIRRLEKTNANHGQD